jgi:gtrA family protein
MYDISLLKYLCVGIVNSILGYAIIFILIYVGVIAEISNFLGYFIAIFVSFYLNKYFTFNDGVKNKLQILKFMFSMVISYILNLIVMSFSYRILEINVYISQILGGFVYTFTGYLLSKNWVFYTSVQKRITK